VLGLSDGNLMRLREGKPIVVHGVDWDKPFDIMIFWGADRGRHGRDGQAVHRPRDSRARPPA
jgi:hypothetical protein